MGRNTFSPIVIPQSDSAVSRSRICTRIMAVESPATNAAAQHQLAASDPDMKKGEGKLTNGHDALDLAETVSALPSFAE